MLPDAEKKGVGAKKYYMNNKLETSRHKPYILTREDADTAILMVHGILGSPIQFELLANNLYQQGYTVMAIFVIRTRIECKRLFKSKRKRLA